MPKKSSQVILTPSAFLRDVEFICESDRADQNFRNFCEAAYCTLAKRTALHPEQAKALEERYMNVVKRYGEAKHDCMGRIKTLFHRLVFTLARTEEDFLGLVYMESGIANSRLGQEFTPAGLSQLVATLLSRGEIDRAAVEALLAEGELCTVCDPCCGSGGMIIQYAEQLRMLGYDLEKTMKATMADVDPLCCQMAFVQAEIIGIPAVVVHANCLTLEEYEYAYTSAAIVQAWHRRQGRKTDTPEAPEALPLAEAPDSRVADHEPSQESPSPTEVPSALPGMQRLSQGDLFSDSR
jgi:hypothetical protein